MATKPTWIGQTLGGRYKIEKLLGQGGMSAVYQATDPNLRRTVAIKLIHAHLAADPQFVRRFEEEAAAVAQLRHSNIIQVYDFNHDDDIYYMVLEYLEGETLGERQTQLAEDYERLSIQDTVMLMIKLTEAVHYAHLQGMVHRDLKPANVMLRADDDPVLMDFGIVKMVQSAGHTASGVIMGTMAYMAPEQIRGEQVDHRIDIYALGVMLFEVLSGRKPFDGESTVTTMMKHLNEPPPDLSSLDPEIPYVLTEVVYKAMEKDRDQRYQSAAEMNAALRQVAISIGLLPASEAITLAGIPAIPSDATEVYQADLTAFSQKSPQTVLRRSLSAPTQVHQNDATAAQEIDTPSRGRQLSVWFGVTAVVVLLLLIFTAFRQGQQRIVSTQATADARATLLAEQSLAATESAISAEETRAAEESLATQSAQATAEADPTTLDDDGDGLSNAEEAELGTDPNDPDSDRDGLTDLNEKAVDCLNPLSPDTDNDGVLDSSDETPCEAAVPAPDIAAQIVSIDIAPFEVALRPDSEEEFDPYGYSSGGELEEQPTATPEPAETVEEMRYVITFAAEGFEPAPRNVHVHFYYNTVAADDSGLPGAGPWEIHVNSDPFTRFKVSDRPEGATEICIIAANGDHTFIPGTGACFPIPDEAAELPAKRVVRANNAWPQLPESSTFICQIEES